MKNKGYGAILSHLTSKFPLIPSKSASGKPSSLRETSVAGLRNINIELNTVVSNHFHSVKILLFSSARSRDFDGLIGIELPVSMYTTKTPIDMCRFNVRSST